jgi:hypothetical protein
MSFLFTRTLVVPIWLLAFGLIIMFAPPPGMITNALVFGGALVAVAFLLLGKRASHSASASGAQPIEVTPIRVVTVAPLARRQRWTSRW